MSIFQCHFRNFLDFFCENITQLWIFTWNSLFLDEYSSDTYQMTKIFGQMYPFLVHSINKWNTQFTKIGICLKFLRQNVISRFDISTKYKSNLFSGLFNSIQNNKTHTTLTENCVYSEEKWKKRRHNSNGATLSFTHYKRCDIATASFSFRRQQNAQQWSFSRAQNTFRASFTLVVIAFTV